jgi:diguanylate cyclase (GGDEF)-like protein/PAS domain S-box-containing protein
MKEQDLTKTYLVSVSVAGSACVLFALSRLPFETLDLKFLLLFGLTIAVGSRITVQIPRFKSHIAVSDTFIFLALLLYGGETAVILAAIEAFFSSLRFCTKNLTIWFNASAMALSTSAVYLALVSSGLYSESQLHGRTNDGEFFVALSVIALTQFFVNTSLASIHDSIKNSIPFWETWKNKYVWTFLTYLIGAAGAGFLVKLSDNIGFGVVIAVFPVIFFVFLTYRMYLKNVQMSIAQAEQAEEYVKVLEEQSAALLESEERFRSAFNYAPIGIALVSSEGNWLKVNRALCNILGFAEAEFLATNFQSIIFPEDLGETLVKTREVISGKVPSCQLEQRYIHKTGKTVWALWSVSSAGDAGTENHNLIFQIQDITDKKEAEERLQHDATHDALTGLVNRSLFNRRLGEALENARSTERYKVSVLFIDLDRFKYVNDSLGHLIGDQLLVCISQRLTDCMRPSDLVARLGGDEFIVMVDGQYSLSDVTCIAERIQQKFSMPFEVGGHEIYSSASIGILHASEKHLTSEDMLRDADTAMYQAKRAGKARHETFDEDMHLAVKETLRLETDLRRAVEKAEFFVHYQPIFSLESGRVEGVEALARWNHAKLGEIPPKKFIPLAEEIGVINELGAQILSTACTEIGSIAEDLPGAFGLHLSVNLSSRQFAQPSLITDIQELLNETGFPATRLKLEITESVFFEHQEKAIEMLHQLRALGIGIDVDDFGTGYSNLGYLARLPISALKIDRSFISPINDVGANTEIVRTIISMARNMGLKVVAEGVETEAQLTALKELNCEGAQGYLLAEPMAFDELLRFLADDEVCQIPDTGFENLPIISTLQ